MLLSATKWLGGHGIAMGGLLVDTRPIPLELPTSTEPRRRQLAGWEAPALAGSDR